MDVVQKKRTFGNFAQNRGRAVLVRGGPRSTQLPLPFFCCSIVFTGETATKVQRQFGPKFPKWGVGGVPDLGNSHMFPFFLLDHIPNAEQKW